jgi:hypothetical protein
MRAHGLYDQQATPNASLLSRFLDERERSLAVLGTDGEAQGKADRVREARVREAVHERSGAELGELPDAKANVGTYGRAMAIAYRPGVS